MFPHLGFGSPTLSRFRRELARDDPECLCPQPWDATAILLGMIRNIGSGNDEIPVRTFRCFLFGMVLFHPRTAGKHMACYALNPILPNTVGLGGLLWPG